MNVGPTATDRARNKQRWLVPALLVVMVFIATPSLASADSGTGTPTLSTNQLSYSPGGVAAVSGAGFAAGDTVTLTLADSLTGATYGSSAALVASDGTFSVVDLALPSAFMSTLVATADDPATGDTASTPIAETMSLPVFTPTIATDQQDYSPGSVVTITGSGWPAGDAVAVFTDDSDNHSWSQTDEVIADASGGFTDQVTLPLTFVANYTVTASDAAGLTATTTFTDGNVTLHLPATEGVANMTVNFTKHSGSTNCIGGTVTTGSVGPIASGGTGNIPGFGGSGDSVHLDSVTTTTSGKTFNKWTSGTNSTDSGTTMPGSPTPCISNSTGGANGNITDGYAHFVNSNVAPTVAADNASRTVNEGATATNTGTYSDADTGDNVAITASVGTVTKTGTNSGTWSWSFGTTDGPAQSQTVTITANDGNGHIVTTTFSLTVNNVAPTATFNAPASVNEGSSISLSLTSPSDPSTVDTTAGFQYAFDCGTGSGYGAFSATSTASCLTTDNGSRTVKGEIKDKDGGLTEYTQAVTINNVAPTIAISGAANVNEGSSYSLTLGAVSDPGTDTVSSYVVHWGDGNTDTYSTNGVKTHTYADGPNDYNITVDLTDEDGTFLNRANAFSVHVNNVAPSVSLDAGNDLSVNEGSTHTYSFSVTDPGDTDTYAHTASTPDCGSNGSLVGASYSISGNSGSQTGSFKCSFPDGPKTSHVTLAFTDNNGDTGNTADQTVTIHNVAPTVTLDPGNALSVDEGSNHTYSFSVSDPGAGDTFSIATTYPDCGSNASLVGSPTTTASGGSFVCHFPDGPASSDVKIRVTDGESENALSNIDSQTVTINNVAPTVTITGGPTTVDESTTANRTYTFTVSDPGNDGFTVNAGYPDCGANGTYVADSLNPTASGGTFDCRFPDGPAGTTVKIKVNDGDPGGNSSEATRAVTINDVAPTVSFTGGPTSADESGAANRTYTFTVSDPGNDGFTVNAGYPDCGANGTYVAGSLNPTASGGTFDCRFPDGPAGTTVKIKVNDGDPGGDSNEATRVVTVNNVAPSATFSAPNSVDEGSNIDISLTSPSDPSPADTTASFTYSFSCDGGATWSADSGTSTYSCPTTDNGTKTVKGRIKDKDAGVSEYSKAVTVNNVAPTVTLSGPTSANEGDTKSYSYTWTDPGSADTFPTAGNSVDCGPKGTASAKVFNPSTKSGSFNCTFADDSGAGTFAVTATVTDDDGGAGSDTKNVSVANVAPTITTVTASPQVIPAGGTSTVTATFTDPGTADTHQTPPGGSCVFNWDGATGTTPGVTESNGSGNCQSTGTFPSPGVYSITVTITDDDGGSTTSTTTVMIAVYDPNAGFVTGGGWITSPAGAYRADTTLSGRANFGFNAKYQKGQTIPTGQTEFDFQLGNLNFHSESYDWLVVSGSATKAQYKGKGSINGQTGYGFLLTAYDGSPDKFRIKIWNIATSATVYDNNYSAPDDIDTAAPTAISGGSIVIHK